MYFKCLFTDNAMASSCIVWFQVSQQNHDFDTRLKYILSCLRPFYSLSCRTWFLHYCLLFLKLLWLDQWIVIEHGYHDVNHKMIAQFNAHLGPVSISDKTSYRKISWSLEAARLLFIIVNHSEIWQAHWQHCCRCACQISNWCEN